MLVQPQQANPQGKALFEDRSYIDIEPIQIIGSGSFGYVFKAWSPHTKEYVACKRTTKAGKYVSREFEVLDKLTECPNVIKMLDIFYSRNEEGKMAQNLIFEFCSSNLEEVIQRHKDQQMYIPMQQIRDLMKQILEGMDFVHKKGITHRDLKPENILKTDDGVVKICDFGSAKIIDENGMNTPYIVSRYYRAPELILACSDYTNKIDIWGKSQLSF